MADNSIILEIGGFTFIAWTKQFIDTITNKSPCNHYLIWCAISSHYNIIKSFFVFFIWWYIQSFIISLLLRVFVAALSSKNITCWYCLSKAKLRHIETSNYSEFILFSVAVSVKVCLNEKTLNVATQFKKKQKNKTCISNFPL